MFIVKPPRRRAPTQAGAQPGRRYTRLHNVQSWFSRLRHKSNYGNIYSRIYLYSWKLSFLPFFLPPSSVMKMNGDQKVQSCFDPPVHHLASPQTRQPHHSGSRTAPLQSTAAAEMLKTGSPSGPSRRPGGRSFFRFNFFFNLFPKKEEEVLPDDEFVEMWRLSITGGQWCEGGVVPQCSDFHRLNETRRWRGAWHRGRRDPAPSDPGGASPLLDSRGGWGWWFSLVGGSCCLPSLHRFSPV